MPRIRTIKPEFFKHEGLFEAEIECGLPLRLAFAGIWTICDREGRFKWQPRAIKTDVLPYDDLDFSRVLDALVTRGFLVKYGSGSREFGWVPTFKDHQHINNREQDSVLPPPPSGPPQPIDGNGKSTRQPRVEHASSTREAHDEHAPSGEGKGREGKGRESTPPLPPADASPTRDGQASKDGGGSSSETFREKILVALECDPSCGTHITSQKMLGRWWEMEEAEKWVSDLGLSEARILAIIRDEVATRNAKGADPIGSFKYLTPIMQRAAATSSQRLAPTEMGRQPQSSEGLAEQILRRERERQEQEAKRA